MHNFVNESRSQIIYLEYPEISHEKEEAGHDVEHDDLQLKSENLESTIELSSKSNNKLRSNKTTKLKNPPAAFEDNDVTDESPDESSDKDEENQEKSTIKKSRTHKLKNERSRSQCQVCGKMYAELSRYIFYN